MSKRIIILFTVICMAICMTGCHFSIRKTVEDKDTTLPPLRIDSSLVCSVDSIEGNRCLVTVLEGNGTYDADDEVYVTYESVAKKEQLHRGDVITFSYNYVTDVSAIDDMPHITVETVTIVKDYTPPTTAPDATEEESTN